MASMTRRSERVSRRTGGNVACRLRRCEGIEPGVVTDAEKGIGVLILSIAIIPSGFGYTDQELLWDPGQMRWGRHSISLWTGWPVSQPATISYAMEVKPA
jgi:hypothetical protein